MCQLALGLAEELPRIDRRLVLGLLLLLFLSVQHGGNFTVRKGGACIAVTAGTVTEIWFSLVRPPQCSRGGTGSSPLRRPPVILNFLYR
jgi:hypothetical protein